ncbi:MAG: hypothetical protein OHK0046_30080 [Anaerolineae bacterium]
MRFHDIAETRLHAPLTDVGLLLLGEVCGLVEGARVLDLACGRGELLARWAAVYGVTGVGVDAHTDAIRAAQSRAYDLSVRDKVVFIEDDPATYPEAHHQFEVVTWLGTLPADIETTLTLMRPALTTHDGLLVLGLPYWREAPTDEVMTVMGMDAEGLPLLPEVLDTFRAAGCELAEMVLADEQSWDRYEAAQWMRIGRYVRDHANDRDAAALHAQMQTNQQAYLHYGRRYMGWGAFVLRAVWTPKIAPQYSNPDQPVGAEIGAGMLWVRLEDGRVIGNPLAWYPWLTNAEDLEDMILTSVGLEWLDRDERITVKDMLRGQSV